MSTRIGDRRSLGDEKQKNKQSKELNSSLSLLGKRVARWVSTVPAHHNPILFKKTCAELSPEFEVRQMIVDKGDINDEIHLLVQKTRKELV